MRGKYFFLEYWGSFFVIFFRTINDIEVFDRVYSFFRYIIFIEVLYNNINLDCKINELVRIILVLCYV